MYGTGACWWADPGVKQNCLLESSADPIQQFAVLGHGLGQILHKHVLHNRNTSKVGLKTLCVGLAADLVQQLAIFGHGLDQILHHVVLHKIKPPKFEWCKIISVFARSGAGKDRDQVRSRMRAFPYSSIALMRSCFMELFFIAIPPWNYGAAGCRKNEY